MKLIFIIFFGGWGEGKGQGPKWSDGKKGYCIGFSYHEVSNW